MIEGRGLLNKLLNHMTTEDITKEELALSKEMAQFPMKFCNACFFGDASDPSGKVNNGTMTLVRYKGEKFGITNFHVIDAYRKRLANEPDIKFYIGNTLIDIEETLFDENEDLDLCTLYLDAYEEKDFGSFGDIPTHFFEIDEFPLAQVSEGEFVLFGGFPGVWRTRPETNHLVFDSLSTGGTEVAEVTDMNIRCELAIDNCLVTMNRHDRALPDDFGGLSGGPMFARRELSSGVTIFKLAGIIYQHMPEYDSITIRPVTFINECFHVVS